MKTNLYHLYPTMKCNLDCQHCFLFSDVRKDKRIMTLDEFKTAVDKIALHFKNDDTAEFADVTIIGGEPTTVPARFYEDCIPYLRAKFNEVGKQYLLSIVTNFTNIKGLKKIAPMFDMITTSYEYDRFDAQLISAFNAKKSIWWKNLDEWIETGHKLGLSISLTKDTSDNVIECLDMLYETGVRYFQFNYMHPDGELLKAMTTNESYEIFQDNRRAILTENQPYKAEISGEQTVWGGFEREAKAMKKVLHWYIAKRKAGQEVSVYPIESHANAMSGRGNDDGFLCPSMNSLCVRTDGEVTGCTIESGQRDAITYGNVYTDDLSEIMESKARTDHVSTLNTMGAVCYGCEFYSMCRGNCKFRNTVWSEDPNDECQGLKSYLLELKDNLDDVTEFAKVFEK